MPFLKAHNRLHVEKVAGNFSREDSRTIADVVFDALSRANILLIDKPSQPTPEVTAAQQRDPEGGYLKAPEMDWARCHAAHD
jgi:hypothetical protein